MKDSSKRQRHGKRRAARGAAVHAPKSAEAAAPRRKGKAVKGFRRRRPLIARRAVEGAFTAPAAPGIDWEAIRVELKRRQEKNARELKEKAREGNREKTAVLTSASLAEDLLLQAQQQSLVSQHAAEIVEGLSSQPSVEALTLAVETFGDVAAAKRFLATPNPFFGSEPPLVAVIRDEAGIARLKAFLGQIEHGLPV